MDLSFRAIHDVVHPTAAFSVDLDAGIETTADPVAAAGEGWQDSQLNPKNRIDSLDLLEDPLWRIDGASGLGTQFFAVPLFLKDLPPMRLDVFVFEGAAYSPLLRDLLDLDQAFHTKERPRVNRLGISRYILRILQLHTLENRQLGPAAVQELYQQGPFGSRIIIEHLSLNVRDCEVSIVGNYDLEMNLVQIEQLAGLWKAPSTAEQDVFPPRISILDLTLVRQLSDSVCLVLFKRTSSHSNSLDGDQLLIMKSLISDVRYLYHEIHTLLFHVPNHPNIISKPKHLITTNCKFGGKRGIVGFTIPYHANGSLRDILPVLRMNDRPDVAHQLRWARQLSGALATLWDSHGTFYPDLRLDNVVLSDAGNAVIIDFEQRGVWCGFAPPEVDTFEHLRILAGPHPEENLSIPEERREYYQQALADCNDDWDWTYLERVITDTDYSTRSPTYNIAWMCLTKREQEAAMVYMLGRVLWCIFEGMSAPHAGAVWQSYRSEPELEFPHFSRTPPFIRDVILNCIGSTDAEERNKFIRTASKLYMKREVGHQGDYVLTAENIREEAKSFWAEELRRDEAWLEERKHRLQAGTWDESSGRLTLAAAAMFLAAL